jgi:hypothetical protein
MLNFNYVENNLLKKFKKLLEKDQSASVISYFQHTHESASCLQAENQYTDNASDN